MEPVISISPSRIPLNNLASAGFEEESELGYQKGKKKESHESKILHAWWLRG